MPDREYWEGFFDAPCILGKLGCDKQCGDLVEFGCGYGLFTEAAAKVVAGTVYALDIEPEMLEATRQRIQAAGLSRVVTLQRDFLVDGCGRPEGSVSYAMLFNILHIVDPVLLLREAYRVLEPGGKLGIIHWNYDADTPRGPSMDIRPRPEQCQLWAEVAGFQTVRFEPLDCSPYHYGLIAQKDRVT